MLGSASVSLGQEGQDAKTAVCMEATAAQAAEVLAEHQTISVFMGFQERPCMGRTALCPDRCGHAKKVAVFKVLNYVSYDKPGEYGDEKQTEFYVDMNETKPQLFQDKAILTEINKLTPGQVVVLNWEHLYVTDQGSKYPTRPVTLLEPVKDLEGKPILITVPKLEAPKVMPLPARG